MWVAKRLDMPWWLLGRGLRHTTRCRDLAESAVQLEALWTPRGDALAALSVRSALDLYLSAVGLPRGSEVLMSAITLEDMRKVVEAHGLKVIPLDLDTDCLEPNVADAERLINQQTRAVLIAHLFGGRVDLRPWHEFCQAHGLLLIEDCAQAFDGRAFTGQAGADASLFSFGPIKTATALGGALATVRDQEILCRMREIQFTWPVQSTRDYRQRIIKYAALKLASAPVPYELLRRRRPRLGASGGSALKNFPGHDLLAEIRHRPCAALLDTLHAGLADFDENTLLRRTEKAVKLHESLDGAVDCPGFDQRPHNHWVFPIFADRPEQLLTALARAGFDAVLAASMRAVPPPADRPELEAHRATAIAERLVYLPCYQEMPDAELHRMAAIIRKSTRRAGAADADLQPAANLNPASPVRALHQLQ